MTDKENIGKIADTILQKDIEIKFDIRPVNFLHGIMQQVGIMKRQKSYTLRPITLGTLIKISKLLIDIDIKVFDMNDFLESNYRAISMNGDTVSNIIALALHGRPGDPPKKLAQEIQNNFTTKDLQTTLSLILGQMDIQNFMLSIISVKGMDTLMMSPAKQAEIIAPGQLSAVS